jgi:hypothetical protein
MALVDLVDTQPMLPGKPLYRSRALWIAGIVFAFLFILTTICGSMFNVESAPKGMLLLSKPAQTATAAQNALATIQAANVRATQCITDGGYVLIWDLFGTPTPTPTPAR